MRDVEEDDERGIFLRHDFTFTGLDTRAGGSVSSNKRVREGLLPALRLAFVATAASADRSERYAFARSAFSYVPTARRPPSFRLYTAICPNNRRVYISA